MKISRYIQEYTSGDRILFKHILSEGGEMCAEIVKMDKPKIHEEWQDTLHFLQLWLYWRFKIDGDVWQCTQNSVNKFMNRIAVWQRIYEYVGLPKNVSKFCGNYARQEKVIKQLGQFGIPEAKAIEAYNTVVHKIL